MSATTKGAADSTGAEQPQAKPGDAILHLSGSELVIMQELIAIAANGATDLAPLLGRVSGQLLTDPPWGTLAQPSESDPFFAAMSKATSLLDEATREIALRMLARPLHLVTGIGYNDGGIEVIITVP
jgi:hypothetical protein